MSKGYCDKTELTAIADAIRTKTGKTDTMTLSEMPTEIENIKAEEEYENTTLIVKKMKTSYSLREAIKVVNLDSLDITGITSFGEMFYSFSSLNSVVFPNLNTESITSIHRMFANCTTLREVDLSNCNFSNVTSTGEMFSRCNYLTSIKFSSYKLPLVTNMNEMFYNCYKITSLDLKFLNSNVVSSMNSAFSSCYALEYLDLSSLDTSKLTTSYSIADLFAQCSKLSNLILGENWFPSTPGSFSLSSCPLTHDSCLDVFNKLADRSSTSSATLTLSPTTKALMSADEIKIATDKGWTVS